MGRLLTRPTNTNEEKKAEKALLDYLQSIGILVSPIEREINDKPDLCFQADDHRVGCECAQIPPSRIYKYLHSRFKQLEKEDQAVVRIIWPQEQHYWVKEAIESKNNKINAYKKICGADKLWLLIHSPMIKNDETIRYERDDIMGLIKYAAKKTPHNFDEIYFYGPKSGITKIFPALDPKPQLQEIF